MQVVTVPAAQDAAGELGGGAGRLFAPKAGRPTALGRVAPFRPEGRLPAIFLLCIPRCGAGSVLRFLQGLYGANAVLCRAETRLEGIFSGAKQPVRADCLAGTLPLVRWLHFTGAETYARVTVLRHPWARMVSQINHLAALGPEEAVAAGPSVAALAHEVGRADFTSRTGLERFINRLRLIDGGFDNLQVRMLLTGTMSAMVKQITARDVDMALQQIQRFAVVGFCEDQLGMQRALVRLTGVEARIGAVFEGAGRSTLLSVRNTLARDMLAPLYECDMELYARARAMSGGQGSGGGLRDGLAP